uniref:Cytochrome b561 domain-containing protein n=1 Tax=Aureoumbra lagunensis TaxID=44058 RepID=A0A7S3JYL0_9STRA|mmetsp:Transcript_17876/g.21673  ORF Transcript_17876/g.21673 Transcript_17876/m.21673 type:complete len:139 (+) Transcript_17876:101-517(+)
MSEKTKIIRPTAASRVLTAYGIFLSVMGWYGYASHNFNKAAAHSLYAGFAGGFIMLISGLAISGGTPEKGQPGYKGFMIILHLALIFVALFLFVFTIQFFRSLGPEKKSRRRLFLYNALGSAIALMWLLLTKPRKKEE